MSGYIRVGTDVKNDVKLLTLTELLGLRSYAAVGLITLLGAWTERYQDGNCFEKLPKSAICEAIGWNKSADRLFCALAKAGILKTDSGREYLDLGGLTLSKAEAERAAAKERMRNLRVKRSACDEEEREERSDIPVKQNNLTINNPAGKDGSEKAGNDYGTDCGSEANENRTNDGQNVREQEGEGDGPSLSPPSSPRTPYYSSQILPSKKNNKNKAAAAAESWEAIFEKELCPPGEAARAKIGEYLSRGAEEELICAAIREAGLSGARTPKYLYSILDRCVGNGIFTKESFLRDLNSKREKRPQKTCGGSGITERELSSVRGFAFE